MKYYCEKIFLKRVTTYLKIQSHKNLQNKRKRQFGYQTKMVQKD